MWQLFAAAVAASTGLIAGKHIFFKPTAVPDHNAEPPRPDPNNPSAASPFQSQPPPWEINDFEEQREGTIFRFSSEAASGRGRSGTQFLMRMKTGSTGSKKKKGVDAEAERSNGVEQRRTTRRGVGVCLKRRKTGKNVAAAKCGSSSSKDLFSWGLNVGIMYVMSAGKAEINKLNTAMDETARIVQELKSELHKRKSPHTLQVSCSANEAITNYRITSNKLTQPEINNPSTENRGAIHMQMSSFTVSEDAECASSVLTEEQDPHSKVMDMDQLEAELESELKKLPWCTTDTPRHEGLSNLGQDIVSEFTAQGFHDLEGQGFVTQEFHGVLPAQLDQKLCHVLIEQQESQIVELESELHSAQSKLQHKETELETLKDCVRRLTELSIGNVSDDENETSIGQEQTTNWNHNTEGCESTKPTVGMKRPIDSES